ncbi:SRPBCC family protein [Frigoribacterium sp. VKM Ac-1396]|jgi:hypothetical protein|uniref:SRPBCC family protein n=1 Tax=Frigoribacterium sp. VKM Ac-1396 TaxID=2783821 RepID=UPI00188DAB22|nr:SRPBCC family protein [Frigoribacterium sp. VKM Ac-1396]MBF4600639.1 SRPBCC family protein [Frigoribacterium sp. VKM Ac-1396]
MTVTASASTARVVAAALERTWRVATPLTPVGFYPRAGVIPAVVAVHDQTGPWDAVGRTRRLELSDGSSVVESLVRVEPDGVFVYELSRFTGLLGRLVTGGRADWSYSSTPNGRTRVDWTYSFFARPGRGLIVRGIVRFAWAPYMRRVLVGIAREVERVGQPSA